MELFTFARFHARSGNESAVEKALERYSDSRDLVILVSDLATQQVVGALLGRTSLGIL